MQVEYETKKVAEGYRARSETATLLQAVCSIDLSPNFYYPVTINIFEDEETGETRNVEVTLPYYNLAGNHYIMVRDQRTVVIKAALKEDEEAFLEAFQSPATVSIRKRGNLTWLVFAQTNGSVPNASLFRGEALAGVRIIWNNKTHDLRIASI